MTTPQPRNPSPDALARADEADAAIDDLLAAGRLQNRARLILARSARLQDLHAQAVQDQRQAAETRPLTGRLPLDASPQAVLQRSAAEALIDTHVLLQAAAAQAYRKAATDPLLARLQARIDGPVVPDPGPMVIDVQATEVRAAAMPSGESPTPPLSA